MVVDQASATDDSRTAYFVTDGILYKKSLIGLFHKAFLQRVEPKRFKPM